MRKKIVKGEYYVYVYLDPRKAGKYVYGNYKFLHEPIYVGKGKQKRAYYWEDKNPFLRHKLAKIGKPIILIIAENLYEERAFFLEKELVSIIGRYKLGKGPLTNLTNGGEGSGGWVASEEFKNKLRGRFISEETREKCRQAKRQMTEETKRKMSKPKSEETKRRMSAFWKKRRETIAAKALENNVFSGVISLQ